MVEKGEVQDVINLLKEIVKNHALTAKVELGPGNPTDYTYEELVEFLSKII